MAFHELQFPVTLSYGTRGGPGHKTNIIELDSGGEERVSRWDGARRVYDAAYAVKELPDLRAIQTFAIARKGSAYGFRLKDWLDFSTAADHVSAPSSIDHEIGTGDGATVAFQLLKRYTSGPTVRVRNLTKPVAATTLVSLDNVTSGAGWSVNTATGIVTFSSAPLLGVSIKAGCYFDVPVRFAIAVDEALQISIEDFNEGNLPSIPMLEIIDGLTTSDEFYYGGANTTDPMTANQSIVEVNGRVQVFNPTSPGLLVTLPNPASPVLPPGGPYFYLVNKNGSNSISVRDHNNTAIGTLAANAMGEVVLGSANDWYFR